jgi:hypothetical protein
MYSQLPSLAVGHFLYLQPKDVPCCGNKEPNLHGWEQGGETIWAKVGWSDGRLEETAWWRALWLVLFAKSIENDQVKEDEYMWHAAQIGVEEGYSL